MPSFVYWRLLIYGPKGQDVAITEWKFFDSGSAQIATTSGTASASSNNGGEGPANAFDGNTSTIWTPNPAPTFASPQWIRYQFPAAVTPATYSIQNRNASSPLWAPDNWSLQGSNDGTTWTTVGNYSAAWTTPLQTNTFTVGPYGLGDWYRLLITSVASGSNHCRVGQVVFKDASGTAISLINGYSNASTCVIGADNGSADAFDGLPAAGQWESNTVPTAGAPEWLGYRFVASANVGSFDLYAGNDFLFNNAPLNFSLQKSTDGGTTWVTAGTYTAATWTQGSKQTFGVASIAVSPLTAAQGAALTLTITGTATHFVSGTTTVSVSGTGITVGTVTVSSATSLTAAITISPTAATSAYTITVTTGSEAPTAFLTVTAGIFQRGNIDYDQVRSAARQGAGSKFQMFGGGTVTTGHLAVYDAAGNVIDGGAPGAAGVPTTRLINTTAPLTGGGDLSADRTLAVSLATSSAVGVVKPDATTITVDGTGKLSATGAGLGTVTSIGLSMPAEFAVAGSPVTSTGTLAVTKANEAANSVFAGPSSGAAAQPTFRALATADIPVLTKVNGSLLAVNIDNLNDTTPAAPAGVVNIKFQSDASGNVSAYDPGAAWQTWTPTFDFKTMTSSALTIRYARWMRQGPIGYVEMNFQVTLGGTATTWFSVTNVPVDAVEFNFQVLAALAGSGGTVLAAIGGSIQSAGGGASLLNFTQAASFALGTALVFVIGGSFRIGA